MPKQDRFSELISIYSALNRNEKETISIYTKAFQNRSHKDFKEIGGLIDLIDSDLSITRAQAAKALKIDKKPKLQQTRSKDDPWGGLGQLGDKPELQASRPRVKSG